MKKLIPILIICIAYVNSAFAKLDTTLYYMKNVESLALQNYSENAIPAIDKNDATLIRAIISPADKSDTLYTVIDYFLNGKIKFTCKSSMIGKKIKPMYDVNLQGASIEFFPNGHKRRIVTFENNEKKGDLLEYFSNGRLNTIKVIPDVDMKEYLALRRAITTDMQRRAYVKLIDSVTRTTLKTCLDSAGNILAEDGNGKWVEYRNDYKTAFADGKIKDGLPDGEWRGKLCDTITYISKYKNGQLLEGKSHSVTGKDYPYVKEIEFPEFQGNTETRFVGYLGKAIRYPADAREGNHTGRVILEFVVNLDGTLSDIRVIKHVYPSLDTEAFNALTHSPGWVPGRSHGIPTKYLFTVPISFTLANDN